MYIPKYVPRSPCRSRKNNIINPKLIIPNNIVSVTTTVLTNPILGKDNLYYFTIKNTVERGQPTKIDRANKNFSKIVEGQKLELIGAYTSNDINKPQSIFCTFIVIRVHTLPCSEEENTEWDNIPQDRKVRLFKRLQARHHHELYKLHIRRELLSTRSQY